jgi:hypothetical protein
MTEVDDFFHRHLDSLAEAMKEPEVQHSPHCTHGKRVWMFNRHWPFIHTWVSNCVCVCDINAILQGNRRMQHHIDDIVEMLDQLRD